MPPPRFTRVFVLGAYIPNGGTWVAYHLGRILERDFGIPAFAVTLGDESADNGVHAYDLRMPCVSLAEMERRIGTDDILIVNPSFSAYQFGMRLPGFKLCYVQGFNTYALLDRRFDHYVATSDFVAAFLRTVYALDVNVIPPFVDFEDMPPCAPWEQRPRWRVLPYRKGLPEVWDASFARLREIVARDAPEIELAEPLPSAGVPHRELLARIGAVRYLLTLSAAEGFGLVPLEAMAMSTVVAGYDGFGGRHYLRPEDNCVVAAYPEIELVAQRLITAVRAEQRSAGISRRARETAQGYTYAAFRRAWIDEFNRALAPR